jgi:hypothetical protein
VNLLLYNSIAAETRPRLSPDIQAVHVASDSFVDGFGSEADVFSLFLLLPIVSGHSY